MEVGKKIKLLLVFITISVLGCHSQERKGPEHAKEFIKDLENVNVEIFYSMILIPRRFNPDLDRYQLGRLVYEFIVSENRQQIDLPVIKKEMKDDEIEQLPFYNNIKQFSTTRGITIDSAKVFISDVVSHYEALKVVEITSHPDLGRFIRFKINTSDELVYKEDDANVNHEYWQKFFKTALKLADKWYFRNLTKQQ